MRRALLPAAVLVLAGLSAPRFAFAQGENAVAMRAGTFRLSVGAAWQHYTERFGAANPLRPTLADGTPELLSIDMSSESLGVAQLPFLAPVQDSIRSLTGLAGFGLNMGRHRVTLDASVRHQPIRLLWAPLSKLVLGVSVPLVRARMSTFVLGADTAGGDALTRGNVGLNAPAALDPYRTQADAALLALADVAANGPAGLRAQAQAELNALRPIACGLSTLGTASGTDPASPCFSAAATGPSTLLPAVGTEAADSIGARLGRAQTSYATTRAQFATAGVTIPAFDAAYLLPATVLDSNDQRRFISDPAGPLAADSLTEVVRTGIGDIEVGGWFQLADGARLRSQLQFLVRLPTGKMDDPDNFQDIGTGDHQTDIEVTLRNDIVLSRNLWLHAGGRYGVQMADQMTRRVTPWYVPLATAATTANVNRDLGDYWGVDLVPNWQLDDAIGVGLGWHYFHQGATTWGYVDPADMARLGVPANDLGLATEVDRMRVGAGVTFSTLTRHAQGRARLPYRVTWSYNATMWGRGGQVPKAGVMTLEIQAFFGNLR